MVEDATAWAPGSADPKVAFAEFKLHLRTITPRPVVVPVIVALNVLVFAVMVASGVNALNPQIPSVLPWGVDFGPLTLGGQPWRLVTNVFVHFGALHLVANMVALLSAGPIIERIFGRLPFAVLYLTAGIAGSLLSLAAHPLIVSAGASGAIFGVYGALGAFVLLQRGAIPRTIFSRLGSVAGSFILYNVVYGAGNSRIDNMAHLGGLLGGAAAGAFLARPLVEHRAPVARRSAGVLAAACALAAGVIVALPRPIAFTTVAQDFAAGESVAIDRYNGLIADMEARRISLVGAADVIDHEILPVWRQTGDRLASERRAWAKGERPDPRQARALDLLAEVVALREDGLTRLATALRTGQGYGEISRATEARYQAIVAEIKSLNSP